MFKNKTILITGGTGTLGQALTGKLLGLDVKKIIIYSRDEFKQSEMQKKFTDGRLRFFIGDVRDVARLRQACKGVDYIIHTAALKQIPAVEYNPQEAVKTNILGALNVIQTAIDSNVEKVVALSTDKAVHPVNLYGATKLCSDKLFINGNALGNVKFAVVRYGNVEGSRGSVIPYFKELISKGIKTLPVTDERMTRFHLTVDRAVDMVFKALQKCQGGEIFVAKIPSYNIIDLVNSMGCKFNIIGIRPGEKLHEVMITEEDANRTYDCGDYFIIQPAFDWIEGRETKGEKVPEWFSYSSNKNKDWLFI